MPSLLACPDKLRGTLTACQAARAIAEGAKRVGWTAEELPVADGGEGFLDALVPPAQQRSTTVPGPLGAAVEARWGLREDGTAVVEMAEASGLLLVGGKDGNDPVAASTKGTGEVLAAALAERPSRLLVGLGGSATTDGGLGAVEALLRHAPTPFADVEVLVACDVEARFVEAAAQFGPQKGATPAQVTLLERRLRTIAERYRERFGIDVLEVPGTGAAGGLAGGLLALGAHLVGGFDLVAEAVGLHDAIARADLVVTAEGRLDPGSFTGKAVGGVVGLAAAAGVPALVIAGVADPRTDVPASTTVVDLTATFGEARAHADTAACLADAVAAGIRLAPRR